MKITAHTSALHPLVTLSAGGRTRAFALFIVPGRIPPQHAAQFAHGFATLAAARKYCAAWGFAWFTVPAPAAEPTPI
jgi:hypothetical protein